MSTKCTLQPLKKYHGLFFFLPAVALLVATSPFVAGQTASETTANNSPVADATQMLPDAPGESSSVATSDSTQSTNPAKTTKPEDQPEGFSRFLVHSDSIIFAHETAPPLTANQKVVLGLKQSVSPFAITGWVFSAGFAQLRNGSPNYGTDKGAYGARLGATALRNLSESVLGSVVLAPLLHEDPRYYELGRDHSVVTRGLYAVSRVFVTRSDSGHATPNISLIGGNLAGAALTNTYYPRLNQGFTQTAMTFGSSLGGSAIGLVFSEFYGDALRIAHLKKNQ